MNHKRRKRKNARAGCVLCKPHKANGAKNKERARVVRRSQDGILELYAESFEKLAEA